MRQPRFQSKTTINDGVRVSESASRETQRTHTSWKSADIESHAVLYKPTPVCPDLDTQARRYALPFLVGVRILPLSSTSFRYSLKRRDACLGSARGVGDVLDQYALPWGRENRPAEQD